MIGRIRIFLRESPVFRSTLYPLIRWLFLDLLKFKQRNIRRFGYMAVGKIDEISTSVGLPCYAAYGTLLGFVRDHGFISHDADLDFGVMPGSGKVRAFYEASVRAGFYFERFITMNGSLSEFSLRYREISIDFFCFSCAKDDPSMYYACAENRGDYWGFVKLPVPTELIPLRVHGVDTHIPKNYEEILNASYGNWHVVVKKWDDNMSPGFVKDYNHYDRVECRDVQAWEKMLESL